jgi:heterodisulfide reductase subunit A
MSDTVLVVGGGIAGIQASLDLAKAGAGVVLLEREATIGGVMAALDKNFPTLDCSICIEAPKMSEVALHPNIEVLSLSELETLEGAPGKFLARIRQKARYVTDACTRCGECASVCPVVLPNEFDAGMAARRAIYTPIPQAVPGSYLIDIKNCLNDPPNYLPCNHCLEVCPPKAIDLMMPGERTLTREVGAVILATGYDMLDPGQLQEYGYGTHPDILTALEFERLVNSAGPTGGEIICPSDRRHPENVLFVLCVGSRDRRHLRYCSRFCCMYSIKHAYQAIDHGVKHVTLMYMDIRAFGKGFDGFWQRTQQAGARFIRGRPAHIQAKAGGKIRVLYEDLAQAVRSEADFDLVVLANAVIPPAGLGELAERLKIELDEDGFLRGREIQGGLVMTTRPGVYAAGCACGPKDIPDSVSEGSGAAALALSHLTQRKWPEPLAIKPVAGVETPRIGVFVCHCGSNIAGVVDVKKVVEFAGTLPGVVFATDQMFTCAGNTQKEIEEAIAREGINRLVIAACSPKTHETIFREVLVRSGLNPYLLEMANIRNMDSWVHKENPEAATQKAEEMVWMAVEKARRLSPLNTTHLPVEQSVLVIGGGLAGMTAATALARQGFETHLVEKQNQLGGLLNQLEEIAPSGFLAQDLVEAKSNDLLHSGVQVHLQTSIETISGLVGGFQAHLGNGQDLQAGAVVIATGSQPYTPVEFGYPDDPHVITNLELEKILKNGPPDAQRITFVACVGSRQGKVGCSRYCCTSMIHQALRLRRTGRMVNVLSKEIRTYSRQAEELYEQAMRSGVRFFRYNPDLPPQEAITWQNDTVRFYDHLLGANLSLPTDLLVLVAGLVPVEDGLANQLKLSHSEDGFYMELHPKLGPAETAVQGVFLAGTSQGAKDVRESIAQALAAAGKASALLSRGVIEKEPLTAHLIPELCSGCMRCVKVCPYNAIQQVGPVGKGGTVKILEAACMGCGTCAAECNFDAIEMPLFTKDQILAQIDAALAEQPESKCLVFACNWCSYAGADLAGIEKRQYPPSVRLIRTMCSARFEEDFVARAFEKGAAAVLITGCRLTETGSDCHYNYANRFTWKRFQYWQRKFARRGIEPERLQLRWISAAEGKEFAEKMVEMDEVVRRYSESIQTDRETYKV